MKTITYLSDIGCLEIQGASLERTLQRDFHQRLVHLDLEYRNGRYSLRRQSSPGAIPEMLSFIQNTGIARILPLRNGRLITCLTDNQEPSPCLIW
ncbi:hypothetical protein O3H75_20590, partial [Escherichia coli]